MYFQTALWLIACTFDILQNLCNKSQKSIQFMASSGARHNGYKTYNDDKKSLASDYRGLDAMRLNCTKGDVVYYFEAFRSLRMQVTVILIPVIFSCLRC